MPKTVSASEAKTQFGSMVDWVVEQKDEIIVQSYGAPRVVIVAFEEYEKLATLRKAEQRRQALAALEELRMQVSTRNHDVQEADAEALADRLAREAAQQLADQGAIHFRNTN